MVEVGTIFAIRASSDCLQENLPSPKSLLVYMIMKVAY